MSHALNGSAVLQRFERGNEVEIRNGMMFDFFPGLPHMRELDNTLMHKATSFASSRITVFALIYENDCIGDHSVFIRMC